MPKLPTPWLIYSLNPRSAKQKLHVDMSSGMIIAWNEKQIFKEGKLFPGPLQRRFHVQRLMLYHIDDVKGKSGGKI